MCGLLLPIAAVELVLTFPQGFDALIILASASAIRTRMLTAASVAHEAIAAKIDEDQVKQNLGELQAIAAELAAAKALAISGEWPGRWVIGSDSVVCVGGIRFGKPRSRDEADEHLRRFSGQAMELTSAVALAIDGRVDWSYCDKAMLDVRELSEEFITAYLDLEWPAVGQCAGVFRMEGPGVQLFDRVEGSHFTILGMPLLPLLKALRERGLIAA